MNKNCKDMWYYRFIWNNKHTYTYPEFANKITEKSTKIVKENFHG